MINLCKFMLLPLWELVNFGIRKGESGINLTLLSNLPPGSCSSRVGKSFPLVVLVVVVTVTYKVSVRFGHSGR